VKNTVDKKTQKRLKNLGVYRIEGGQDVEAAANVLGFDSGRTDAFGTG
jgi:hypothetical protein